MRRHIYSSIFFFLFFAGIPNLAFSSGSFLPPPPPPPPPAEKKCPDGETLVEGKCQKEKK